jgi:hypothetical protein
VFVGVGVGYGVGDVLYRRGVFFFFFFYYLRIQYSNWMR